MRRLLYLAGAVLVGWGLTGLTTTFRHPRPTAWLAFFVGGVATHDLVIAPAVILVGALAARLVSPRLRPYVVSGLIITAVVGVVGYPLARGYGRRSDNPSIVPLDYPRGLLLTLVAVWAGVVAVALVRERLRSASGRRTGGAAP